MLNTQINPRHKERLKSRMLKELAKLHSKKQTKNIKNLIISLNLIIKQWDTI